MATIAEIVKRIRTAVLGIEVRNAIADGIEEINAKVDGTVMAVAQAKRKVGTNGEMVIIDGTSFVEIPFNMEIETTNGAVLSENEQHRVIAKQDGWYLVEVSIASTVIPKIKIVAIDGGWDELTFHTGSDKMLINVAVGTEIILGGISPSGSTSIAYASMLVTKVG